MLWMFHISERQNQDVLQKNTWKDSVSAQLFWGKYDPIHNWMNVKYLDKGLVFVRIPIWGKWCEMVGNFAFGSFVETEKKRPDCLFLFNIQVTGFKWWETWWVIPLVTTAAHHVGSTEALHYLTCYSLQQEKNGAEKKKTKPPLHMGSHSWQNPTSLRNKSICPQRKTKLQDWHNKEMAMR